MSKHWARQEAKTNDLAEALNRVWTWTRAHQPQVFSGAAVLLILGILAGSFSYRRWASIKASEEGLRQAQSLVHEGQFSQAVERLETLSGQNPGTSAWGFGLLLEGDILFRLGDFKKAIAAYQKIIDKQSPKDILPFALSDIALAQESAHDFSQGVLTARRFLDKYKDSFLAPQTHASLARCLKALGHAEEAKSAYKQIVALYPEDAYWNQWAQSQLKAN